MHFGPHISEIGKDVEKRVLTKYRKALVQGRRVNSANFLHMLLKTLELAALPSFQKLREWVDKEMLPGGEYGVVVVDAIINLGESCGKGKRNLNPMKTYRHALGSGYNASGPSQDATREILQQQLDAASVSGAERSSVGSDVMNGTVATTT